MDNHYINIGSPKCCFFVKTSLTIIRVLDQNPFLHFAVEEAMECAKNDYYAAGILSFSQLLNQLNEKTPNDRHLIAHEILRNKPTKEMYESIFEQVKSATAAINIREMKRHRDIKQYAQRVSHAWNAFMRKYHNGNWTDINYIKGWE